MNTFFIILIIVVALVIIIVAVSGSKSKPKYPLPSVNKKVGPLVQNDKLIVAVGVKADEIKEMTKQFCKLYNRNDYKIDVRLHPIEEKIIALTFPNDIDFVVFFYLIKNLAYIHPNTSTLKVLGWSTLLPIDKEKPVSGQAMVYPTENMAEKPIYVSTKDNICWKINFDKNQYEPSTLIQQFSKPPYTYLEIRHRDGYPID